ncbi:hypothetical protein ACS2OW_02980 [Bacillus cereus group sp. BceL035]|uniref:YxeA family protein n=1 Tax=Bacillus tropicus TaxID=2026188 RepID=A0ABD7ZX36_9BACI|nr:MULTISPECIES: hypothetical protein [Bacillus]AJG92431.1 hypothetical protein BG03_2040 [Bacillus cereus]QPR79162.1 hypothetical protein I6G77_08225 [Bacillus tropicus]WMY17689.1 hypothetical protein P3F89_11855 [Bacillus tropicus]
MNRISLKLFFKSILFLFMCGIVVYSIFQIIFVWSVSTGLGRDDIVGFSDNKYVIGRPPVSYNLYKKDSGKTILDNVIGYKKGKTKSYVRNEVEFVVIDEIKGSYELYKIEHASEKEIAWLKEMKKLE